MIKHTIFTVFTRDGWPMLRIPIMWVVAAAVVAAWLWRREQAMRRHVRIALGVASAATRQLHDYEARMTVSAFDTTPPAGYSWRTNGTYEFWNNPLDAMYDDDE